MVPLVLVFAATVSLASSGLVTAKDPIPHTVEGQLGSDLLVPVNEACAYQGSYRFDLLSNTQRIGAYDDELQGLRGYHGRLTYDPETCTITLKRLRAEDGTIFTVNLYYAINHKSITHDIKYKVIIIDHTSCNKTQVSDDAVLGFVSFCLSQDSAVNLVFTLLLLTLQGFCPSLYERSGKVAGLINYIITAISQTCSIFTMRSGNSYSWILIVIPILLISDGLKSVGYLPDCLLTLSPISVFRSMCACCTCSAFYDDDDLSPRCRRITCYLSCGFTSLIQLLFALVVGILYFKSDVFLGGESPGFGYFFLSLFLSMVLRAGSITIIYCYKNKFTLISQEDPTEMPGDPPKDPTKTTVKLQEDPTTPGEPQDNPTKTHDDLQEDPTETPGDPQK